MDELNQLDGDTLSSNNGSDGDQHDNEDHVNVNIVDPPHVDGVPAGEPSAIQDESFNGDEDTTRIHHSTLNQDGVNLLSQLLNVQTEDRKIQYDGGLTNEMVKTSNDGLIKPEGSPIFSKILNRNQGTLSPHNKLNLINLKDHMPRRG